MTTNRSNSRRKDPCWKYFRNPKNTNITICRFCNQQRLGLFRAKRHLVGGFPHARTCEKVPDHVREEVRKYMNPEKTGKKTRSAEEIMKEIQVQKPKSRLGNLSSCEDENDDQLIRYFRKSKMKKKHKEMKNVEQADDDDGLVNVNGYKVQPTIAPILEAIFAKYGDITSHCVYKSISMRTHSLELICKLVQRLQNSNLEDILSDLDSIHNELSDIQDSKIEVSWLNEHLAQVPIVAASKDKLMQLKKAKAKFGILTKAATKEKKLRRSELFLKRALFIEAQELYEVAKRRAKALEIVDRKLFDDIVECAEKYPRRSGFRDLL